MPSSDNSNCIESLNGKRDNMDEKIEELTADTVIAEMELADATAECHATLVMFVKDAAELEGALAAVADAIDVLKAAKNPSLVQLHSVSKTVRTATLLGNALGIKRASQAQQGFVALLQLDPEVEKNMQFEVQT